MSTAYLFPGQGSQYVGMGALLYQDLEQVRSLYERASLMLGYDLGALCFAGPEERLKDTRYQQPALFVSSLAAWEGIRLAGYPAADFFAGHSLGELAALVAAGSLDFAEGLQLVVHRGQLMYEAGEIEPGGMSAILGVARPLVAEVCQEIQDEGIHWVEIANDNCPGQLVISGHSTALVEFEQRLGERARFKSVLLPISIPAHSRLMHQIGARFGARVMEIEIKRPRVPVISNINVLPMVDVASIQEELAGQMTGSVWWTDSINYLIDQGVDTFIEVGPGEVLTGLTKRINRSVKREYFVWKGKNELIN